jgi:hypothetical protein
MFFNPDFLWMAASRGTDFMDFFFYAIAIYEGFRFSRVIVEEAASENV